MQTNLFAVNLIFLVRTFWKGLKLKHREIAESLETSREVVSKVLKKIENEGKIFKDEEGKIWAADQMLLPLNK
ncbi:helix-turn-helix domain-containing protein [Chryseobacterium sp. SG20098]|uniref:helix-turn-helix domain-containing protein n=1 Tax=Chryseobacterium sp. SG20098 TaxID=3074145 RepID=UPI002882D502|nr:helix-turn-helix domain-containing protein [Chryseobacterium sp. SG20098]WNI37877.1 helix-turn-helix domain-containing protein [Chryseobacterium sp. SG20098]